MPKKRAKRRTKGIKRKHKTKGSWKYSVILGGVAVATALALLFSPKKDVKPIVPSTPVVRRVQAPKAPIPKVEIPRRLEDHGKVEFTTGDSQPHHFYVVGQKHEDPIKDQFSDNALIVQGEVYQILKYLREREDTHLLVREGYHFDKDYFDETNRARGMFVFPSEIEMTAKDVASDIQRVKRSRGITLWGSDILALKYEDVILQGAEASHLLFLGLNEDLSRVQDLGKYMEGERFRAKFSRARSAANYEGSFRVAEREFGRGRVLNRNMGLVIGNTHLDDITEFVKNRRITVPPGSFELNGKRYDIPAVDKEFNPQDHGYDVTVIVPNSFEQSFDLKSFRVR